MDSFCSRIGRLAALLALLVVCVPAAHAQGGNYTTQSEALAGCQAYAQAWNNQYYNPANGDAMTCVNLNWTPPGGGYGVRAYGSAQPGYWTWSQDTTSNPCANLSNTSIFVSGKVTAGFSFPETTTDPATGAQVQCGMTATPTGAPVWNPYSQIWQTYVSLKASGNLASGNQVTDGTGNATGIPVPSDFTNQFTTPSVCGTDSCYNPASDQYCASSGGAQFCVSGATARSTTGGCSGTDSVACGGSPTAPLPSSSQIPDPATQVTGSDKYTQADPATGATLPVVVNIYRGSTSTSNPSSGQQAGDSGPASSSSSPSTGSYSGGGDCNTPPVCSGDAATCGAARTQWATTCQVHKDLAGTGVPSDLDSLKTQYSQSDAWSSVDTSQDSTVGGQANQGVYDQSGLGWSRSCPLTDWHIDMGIVGSFDVPLADKCYVGDWIRDLVIGMGLFVAAIITAGGKGSS